MTIQYMVPNPRPLEHESPSITTRPGLPPSLSTYLGTNSTAFEFSRLVNYFTMTLKPSIIVLKAMSLIFLPNGLAYFCGE